MNTSFDQNQMTSQISERASSLVRASGRARKAGYWISGGGIAVILSAFLPWVSIEGMDALHPHGSSVVLLLVMGGLFSYFGARVLQDRLSKALTVALWILSGVDILFSFGIFEGASKLPAQGAGIVSVTPAVGFYLGIGGLLASVVGTVLVQTVHRKKATTELPIGHDH